MATGSLDANGIWIYGEDDSETTFSGLLNKLGDSVSDKFTGGLPIASGGTGATTVAGAQNSLRVGLVPISPTSVTYVNGSGSTDAIGKMSFTTCTAIQVNGVFTSAYENYRIVFQAQKNAVNGNDAVLFRVSNGGTPVSTSTYNSGAAAWLVSTGGFQNLGQNAAPSAYIARLIGNARQVATSVDVYAPALPKYTRISGTSLSSYSDTEEQSVLLNSVHLANTAYDGFYLFASANNITGTLQVFGYN